jgi:hypothetical protein
VPLAKRVAVNDDWIDDCLQLGWQNEGLEVQWSADAGLWKGQVFPGASKGAVVPALHLGAALDDWRVDGFVAHFEPKGRGALIASTAGAHTHATPECRRCVATHRLLRRPVRFDGRQPALEQPPLARQCRAGGLAAPGPWLLGFHQRPGPLRR